MSNPETVPMDMRDKVDKLLLHVIDGYDTPDCRRRTHYSAKFDFIDDHTIISKSNRMVTPTDVFSTTYKLRGESGHVEWNEKTELEMDSTKPSLKLKVTVFRDVDIFEFDSKEENRGYSNQQQPAYAQGIIPFDKLLPESLLSILSSKNQSPEFKDCKVIEISLDLKILNNIMPINIYPRSNSTKKLLSYDEIIKEAEDTYDDALQQIYHQSASNNSENIHSNIDGGVSSSSSNIFTLKMGFLFIPMRILLTKIGSMEASDSIGDIRRMFFGYPLISDPNLNAKDFIFNNIGANFKYIARTKDVWRTSNRGKVNIVEIFEELHEMCFETSFPSELSSRKSNILNDVSDLNKNVLVDKNIFNNNQVDKNRGKNKDENKAYGDEKKEIKYQNMNINKDGNKNKNLDENKNKKIQYLLNENEIPARSFIEFIKIKISKFWSNRVENLLKELSMCVLTRKKASCNGGLLIDINNNNIDENEHDDNDDNKDDHSNCNDIKNKKINNSFTDRDSKSVISENDKIINMLRNGARVRIIRTKSNENKSTNGYGGAVVVVRFSESVAIRLYEYLSFYVH